MNLDLLTACCEEQSFPCNSALSRENQMNLILIAGEKWEEEKGGVAG